MQMLSPRAHTWLRLLAIAAIIAAATFPRAASRDRGLLAAAKASRAASGHQPAAHVADHQ
jgi:hypothetical protein